ncbi:MAG TPA: hypothetical protein H9768_11805 [Candidatus Mailhella merdavium]|nr:hypothetical protein [Candidatus Mailhella merdavium]
MQTLQERLTYIRGKQPRDIFAPSLGIKPTTWRNYELGATLPTSDALSAICNILKISPQWLLLGEGPIRTENVQATSPLPKHASDTVPQAACPHCAELEEELKTERRERRELAAENRQLWRENGELREKVARLEERKRRYELTRGLAVEDRDVG